MISSKSDFSSASLAALSSPCGRPLLILHLLASLAKALEGVLCDLLRVLGAEQSSHLFGTSGSQNAYGVRYDMAGDDN